MGLIETYSAENDMNDGLARDLNPQPLAYHANALPTELLGHMRRKGKTRLSRCKQYYKCKNCDKLVDVKLKSPFDFVKTFELHC